MIPSSLVTAVSLLSFSTFADDVDLDYWPSKLCHSSKQGVIHMPIAADSLENGFPTWSYSNQNGNHVTDIKLFWNGYQWVTEYYSDDGFDNGFQDPHFKYTGFCNKQ